MSNETGQPDVPTANAAVNQPGLPLLSLVPFMLITFVIAWGILALYIFLPVTPLFNASRGSILLTAFFHFTVMNPVLPAAEPYDTYILVVVAAVIVWLNRKTMFRRTHAVTEVVPRMAQ